MRPINDDDDDDDDDDDERPQIDINIDRFQILKSVSLYILAAIGNTHTSH